MKSKNYKKKILKSFDKSYSAEVFFKKPDKYREIEKFSKLTDIIITSGSNFSYAPAGFGERKLSLDLKRFNRILDFNYQEKEITVEAGLKISEFLNFTLKHDLWIPQLPGYPYISLGGAVASNVHGKSCSTHGTIRNAIKKILIFHKTHGWINLSNNENKEIFDLTIGGLGLTGTIVSITFKLSELKEKNFITTKEKVNSLSECMNYINKNSLNNEFIYSWNRADSLKNFGKGFIFRNTIDINSSKKFNNIGTYKKKINLIPLNAWNKFTIKMANIFFGLIQNWKADRSNEEFKTVLFPFVSNESYFNLFGYKGFIESQLMIAQNKLNEFIEEFKVLYKLHKPTITLMSLKNIKGEHRYLRFEDNKVCLTFDFTNDKRNLIFLDELDKLCMKYKVIPSIIKDSRLPKEVMDKCYLEADEFRQDLRKFDKNRLYRSRLSDRLEL